MKTKKNKFFFAIIFAVFLVTQIVFISGLNVYGEKITTPNYEISRDRVEREVGLHELLEDNIEITNLGETSISVSFSVSGSLSELIGFDNPSITVSPEESERTIFVIRGREIGNTSGEISISGDINERIPVLISTLESSSEPQFFVEIQLSDNQAETNKPLEMKIDVNKIKPENIQNVNFSYRILDRNMTTIHNFETETLDVNSSFHIIRRFNFPENLSEGDYVFELESSSNEETLTTTSQFTLKRPFMQRELFGLIPIWLVVTVLSSALFIFVVVYLIKRHIKNSKKYRMEVNTKTLPKYDKNNLYLGKVAETKISAYLEPEKLKTHCIVAGATGGGKSISAQVIIEEALKKNVAVIVFDPTAQWSGMLRKCDDKKMMSYYPKFGLKPTDAKGFPGNIRQVTDAREIIEVKKFINPGQIQIFTLNKLDPKNMDMFVSNVIREIFRSDPKEDSELKVILVFDEVHRLLSKFGGSGEGFLQIERACREFRKWGMGVMLVSQVLNDFVGEIKANINTEVQMRTRDEGDLGRLKTKYGEEFLQSLVKASVGVGMFVNTSYNKGKPYFVNFRPILHNTRRLSDEELEKYNKYNNVVDDLEYQIEQLEKEKVDVFDLKMELKLVKDKIMTGNFSVVDIYLEGLKPRIQKQWEKLGKKPKKREKKLADISEIKKSVEEAKKARQKFEEQTGSKKTEGKAEEKKEESPSEKMVKPLTFDNGMMVSNLKELTDILPNLDDEIFKIHVNENKNEIAKWAENVSPDLAKKLEKDKNKNKILSIIKEFSKPKESSKESEEKESDSKKE